MTQIRSPRHSVEQFGRILECEAVCTEAFAQLVRNSVAAGWREEDIALALADAAEDYVVYLATKPAEKYRAANSNPMR